jgi:peptidase, S41 family
VPEDTSDVTSYYKEAAMRGLILQYAFKYTDENRQTLKKYTEMKPLSEYLTGRNLVNDFANYAEKNGLRRRNNLINKSHALLENYIYSRIIYNILDEQAWNQYLNRNDDMIKAAEKVLNSGEAFPKAPAKKGHSTKKQQNRTT